MVLVNGLKLSSQCDTETRVVFIMNMYEVWGSETAWRYGQENPAFFDSLDPEIVRQILHSTKIPSNLSLETFVNVSKAFYEANPHRVLRVMILGAGCCLEAASIT